MERLPIDVLRIIADILPIRSAVRMMRVNHNMYARRRDILVHTLMRDRRMAIKAPAIAPTSGTVEKIVYVKKACGGTSLNATNVILDVLRTGSTRVTPELTSRTRRAVHLICERLGLNARTLETKPRVRVGPASREYPEWMPGALMTIMRDDKSRHYKVWRTMTISM